MTIDCTLDSLKIPALPTYINEFGTKKSGGGLTTAECADDAMLPFRKMRAYTVNESSETTEIQHNAVFIMTAADTSLVLHDCSADFLGCEARVINTSSGNVTVLGGVSGIDGGISGVTVPPEREARFVFLSDGWHSSYDSLENITEKELADSSVSEDKIKAGAVTNSKIAAEAVTVDKVRKQEFFDLFYPVGATYTQYPQQASPNELWGSLSTWQVVDYSGAFFRAEGGNANSFIEKTSALSKQADATAKNGLSAVFNGIAVTSSEMSGETSAHIYSSPSNYTYSFQGISASGRASMSGWANSSFYERWKNVDTNTQLDINLSHTHTVTPKGTVSLSSNETETRPVNFTVRIWKRVA